MKRAKLFVFLALIATLTIAGTAFASGHVVNVTYTDTVGIGPEVEAGALGSLVRNGDFELWSDGVPTHWMVWADEKSGWENAHLAKMDLALGPPGENYGAGLFVRNIGGSGGYYAGLKQHLTAITHSGYYWVNIHETIWYGGDTGGYNSMAWYAISAEDDPMMVTEWRELNPLPFQCPNDWGLCFRVSRQETVWIDAGSYLHLKVGHKWPVWNAWSVFAFDDISIVPATGSFVADGFIIDSLLFWDPAAPR